MIEDVTTAMRWDDFVLSRPDSHFFQRSGWQIVLTQIFHHECYYLFSEVNGEITGILPLAHVKSILFGDSLKSLPFAAYGGTVAVDVITAERLEQEAKEVALRLNVKYLEIRSSSKRHEDWPAQDLYVTFRKNISPDSEKNMLSIPRKQRAMIRKGMAQRLSSEFRDDVEEFYRLYAENVHRHGTPALPRRYFQLLLAVFPESCNVLLVSAPSGQKLSGVLNFYFRNEVLPYYAGDTEKARVVAANDFKYWELMRLAAERGCGVFDFGRSKKNTGSFSFKKNWGFEPSELYYEYCLFKGTDIPQINPSNPKFEFFIKTWKRLPIRVANRIGPYIVRSLG